jgi:lysophospholipase L1-like esterase
MPDVPILIASMHDRAVKAGTGFRTSPDIPLLVQTQSEIAQETDCAFWNVYEAMGGQNSMLGFVNQNPPLAGTDYTHFTRRGAERIATLFLDFLKEEM